MLTYIKQIFTLVKMVKLFHLTRKIVAGGLIQSKLQNLLPLFGAAPEYLQVQQMAAARAVVGPRAFRWSNTKMLETIGWLNVKQQNLASLLTLTHKIVTTKKPENIYRSISRPYSYTTRAAKDN